MLCKINRAIGRMLLIKGLFSLQNLLMLAKLFRKLVDSSPRASNLVWKYFYEISASLFRRHASWKFMNYGYANEGEEIDDYDKLCENLYRHLLDQVKIDTQTSILEVGCGRGGGSNLMLEMQPKSVTGMDFSANAIKFCQKHFQNEQLSFKVGNAESIPFADENFQVVVNVESSHCYGNRKLFFEEVLRVLKPGGFFLYADFMGKIHYPKRPLQLREVGFEIIKESDITPNVLRSMQLSSDYKEAILTKIPKPFRKAVGDFAGMPGSDIYNNFELGQSTYFAIICRKT